AQYDGDHVGGQSRCGDVLVAVAVEVSHRHAKLTRTAVSHGGLEGAVPVAEQHGILRHEVELAVAVEVSSCYLAKSRDGVEHRRQKGTAAGAHEHAHSPLVAVVPGVSHSQVGDAVGVEIPDDRGGG